MLLPFIIMSSKCIHNIDDAKVGWYSHFLSSDSHFKEWYIILYQFQLVPNTFALSNNCLNKLVRFIPCHNELMFSPIFFAPWTFIHFIHNRGAKQFNLTGLCLLRDAPIKEVSECSWVFEMKHKLNQIVFLLFNKLNCISIFNKSNCNWDF